MSSKESKDGNIPLARVQLAQASSARVRWQLLWRGNTIELPRECPLVIGRGPRCDVVIDHAQVSRTHCRLSISDGVLNVEDLNSSNGLYVNGERVVGSRPLATGDHLLVGQEEFIVCSGSPCASQLDRKDAVLMQEAPADMAESPASWRRVASGAEPQVVTTRKADAFATLGRLADRLLASGRHDAASKILAGHMKAVLAGVRDGQSMPDEVIDGSTRYALKLASALSEPSWVDFVFDLYLALKRPLPWEAIEQIRGILERGATIDRDLLSRYKQIVRTAAIDGAITDRVLANAILALNPGPAPR